MGTVNINGKIYQGDNVEIRCNKIIIDGVERREDVSDVVEVRIMSGEPVNISSDASITCNNVRGNLSAGGSVNCDDISGNVSAGGSVRYG